MDKGSKFDLSHLNLNNFRKFLESPLYQKSLRNSFFLSISVMIFSLLIGIPMGYIVARVQIPAKNLLLSLGILPVIMPSFVGLFMDHSFGATRCASPCIKCYSLTNWDRAPAYLRHVWNDSYNDAYLLSLCLPFELQCILFGKPFARRSSYANGG